MTINIVCTGCLNNVTGARTNIPSCYIPIRRILSTQHYYIGVGIIYSKLEIHTFPAFQYYPPIIGIRSLSSNIFKKSEKCFLFLAPREKSIKKKLLTRTNHVGRTAYIWYIHIIYRNQLVCDVNTATGVLINVDIFTYITLCDNIFSHRGSRPVIGPVHVDFPRARHCNIV